MDQTIPKRDSDFDEKQNIISAAANLHIKDWDLENDWMTNVFNAKKALWDAAWLAYKDPMTRTPLITFTKTDARKNYESPFRLLVRNLQYNVLVTDDDRKALGIVIPSHDRRPLPPLTTYPDYTIDSATLRRLTVHFRDHDSEKRAKPHQAYGVEIVWSILTAPPVDVEELIHSNFDTHTPFTLEFKEHERGANVYFCLRWEGTKGNKGPWGGIQSARIP
jgi:hypothetical protein